MKINILTSLFIAITLLFSGSSLLHALIFNDQDDPSVKGKKIIEESDKASTSPLQMEYEVSMLIIKGNPDNPIIKKSKNYQKKYNENEVKRLSVSTYPGQLKILTHSYTKKDDDMWIKLSTGAPKRISGKGKQGYVQNSHFTYEDMESEDIDDYEYNYLGDTVLKVEGKDTECYKVMKRKVKGEESVYSKGEIYLRKSDLFTVRIDLWDINDNPHKTIRILKIAAFSSGKEKYTIAVKTGVSLIDDPTTESINEGQQQYTIMEMSNIKIDGNAQIDESLFRKESL
ncbi:MAG: outer membrane lipoprotein-sorting protein [Spirochaetales bacterium]|nr:outer membrane lipoprotein-sorting protein [Spirochaetales bacterium]